MREALSEAEQNELALRMQKSGEWLRRGYGAQTWPQQDSISAGLDRLNRQLAQSEAAMAPGTSQSPEDRQQQKMAEALSQVQSLRQQMQAAAERRPSGGQAGQEAAGRSGATKSSGNQKSTGSQQGSGTQQGSSGSPDGQGSEASSSSGDQQGSAYARNGGEGHPRIGGGGSSASGAETDATLSELQSLKSALGHGDRQLERSVNDAIGSLRQDRGQAGLLDARINDDAITSLERLEMELTRRVGEADSGARTTGSEPVPEGYRNAVAEYFKRLSK
jgi:hypothetical protein